MRRKNKFLIGALLLFLTAAAVRIPTSYVEAESASASDFQMKGDTLVKYTGTAGAVSIPTSVKHIGKEAFAGHTELVKVQIPAYVESIDYNAFAGCSSLESIAVPDTVTEIGNGAFSGCSSLKSIKLGKKLKKLGNGVFADCISLSSANISRDNEVFAYDSGVIYSKDKKIVYNMLPGYKGDTYKMPSSVEEIRSNAFWGCKNLKKVEIGNNVKSIPDYAFTNCTNLEKVMFPFSLHSINLKAFADCINLGDTQIPMSVSFIHATAFDGCPKLTIIAEEGSVAAEYEANRDKSNVAQTEYQDIFGGEAGENAVNGESGQSGENNAVQEGTSGGNTLGQSSIVGGNAVVFIDNSQSRVLSGNVRPDTGDKTTGTEVIENQQAGEFPKYTIVNNEKIASQAFYNDKERTQFEIPESIKGIGDFAFARSGLTSVVIPEGVTSIGYGAFYHCDDLADVTIPATVSTIEPAAFAETKWLKKCLADNRNPFIVVGDGILVAYSGKESKVEIPSGVKQIGAEVFKNNTRITSVSLPESLTLIGEDAFSGCSSLVSISGGSGLVKISDRAFEGCPISTVKIPASVKEIGLKAYDMSAADKEDETKNAVFLGKTLPKVSYERTATRLSNEMYRDAVFKDVRIAIVDDGITASDIQGTVLDYNAGGFCGLICSVETTAEGENPGRLKVKFCAMPKEDAGSDTIPEHITVYGKTYEIASSGDDMIYLGNPLSGTEEGGMVKVEVNSRTLPDSPAASAQIQGSDKDFILHIDDNASAGSMITAAYRQVTSGGKMASLQVYDITLYDAEKMIPISKLGKQQMTVTLPKPKGIGTENLRVVCLDEDGQLEKVDARLVTVNGEPCVQFAAKHFSVYGIYN